MPDQEPPDPRHSAAADGERSDGTAQGDGARRESPGELPPELVRAVDRVGDRWILLIVASLLDGPRRFGDLGAALGVAPNILTARLRRLGADGIVVARPYCERPVRNEYVLTGAGRELADAVALLAEWGARLQESKARAVHVECGTALEVRPWCPSCERPVSRGEARPVCDH